MTLSSESILFTLAFSSIYTPRKMISDLSYRGIKVWIDKNGTINFNSERYGGPKNNEGILQIDHPTILITLEKEALLEVLTAPVDEQINLEVGLLFKVYGQLEQQLGHLKDSINTRQFKANLDRQSEEIDALKFEFNIRFGNVVSGVRHAH